MSTISFNEFLKKANGTPKDVSVIGNEAVIPKQQSYLQDAASDINQIGTDIATLFKERQAKVQEAKKSNQSGLETLYQTAGQGAGLVSDIFGSLVKGAVKTVLPQAVETKIKSDITSASEPIVNSDIVRSIISKYNSLDEETKRNLDATLGIGSLALDVATLGGGKKVVEVGMKTGLQGATKVAELAKPVVSKTGSLLKSAGETSTALGVSMSEPTKIALQAYEASQPSLLGRVKNFFTGVEKTGTKPITEANTAVRLGLAGTEWQLGVQAKKISSNIWDNIVQPALNTSDKIINKSEFFGSLRNKIIKENADLTRRNALLEALDSFADDYKHVSNFSLPKLQEYKEGWAKFINESAYKGKPIAGALNDVRNMAAQNARDIIYKDLGNTVKTAYLDYGNLQNIAEFGRKTIDPLRSKGITRQVWEAVLDKAITPVTTFTGKVLYKTGNGLELVGNKGAKTVRDIIR